ncbi:mitochondrial fission ELM1 family protein [Methylohalobius crimeensis]|uniref:mitochondrial fission ELM1 family protein n=1 Tax=Methylohalobius crimeensis TaxID=244365 RepID=UPI0003B2E9B1|nr:ELM1/GtrOC1 family putative glycosyltransferase [Methylohalobius crimeensis]
MTKAVENYNRSDSLSRVWLLCGHKAGDNQQLLALADALAWPYTVKRMHYRAYELLVGRWGATLAGIRRKQSDALDPPWPDLILTAGRRNEPVALWIRKQAAETGRTVRIVHLGRPWAPLRYFDLIVTTPQYQLPRLSNVYYIPFPLHRLTGEKLRSAAADWRSKITAPGPYIALLVGGSSGPYVFDARAASELARQASVLAREKGASLLVTGSARTSAEAMEALAERIDVPAEIHRWRPSDPDNPYLGYLALAEEVIVTGESMSMLAEACFTGKPVHIFPFGAGRWAMRAESPLPPGRHWWDRERLKAWRSAIGLILAPRRLRRDIRRILQDAIAVGRAVWLGEPFVAGPPPLADELARTVEQVRTMLKKSVQEGMQETISK